MVARFRSVLVARIRFFSYNGLLSPYLSLWQ